MRKSNYSFNIVGNQLRIVDEWYGNFMSVTNNFENVLTEIRKIIGPDIVNMVIVYKDTNGDWGMVKAEWIGEECINVIFL